MTLAVELEQLGEYPSSGDARRLRATFANGRTTTVHAVWHAQDAVAVRLVEFEPPMPVQAFCADAGVAEAVNGGFFTKPDFAPLGELVRAGELRPCTPFEEPWGQVRGVIAVDAEGRFEIGPRSAFPAAPTGDLLQAAPLLVHGGEAVAGDDDPEGLATTCAEFDSDITAEPLPRTAIATTSDSLLVVAADGRSEHDDGLLFSEFAALLVHLGAVAALNLDGGSSSALVTGGERRNCPRNDEGTLLEDGYPTPTAFLFEPREG